MKEKWPTVIYRGHIYRVCHAKSYMLSKCFYCSFNCDVTHHCSRSIPPFLRCKDGTYFKRITDA